MTTPEQLAKWHEAAEKAWGEGPHHGEDDSKLSFYAGFLCAKQQNEQALKDARKRATEDVNGMELLK